MLNDVLSNIKNFLFVVCVFLFCVLISVKNKVYKIKSNIREIDNKIVVLNKEAEVVNLELTYLTTPERLKNIYANIKENNISIDFDDSVLVAKTQIKDIMELIPYYYAKIENNENSVAQK